MGGYSNDYGDYNGSTARSMAIGLLVLASLQLIIQIVIIVAYLQLIAYFVVYLITLLLVFLAGGLGVCAARSKTGGLIRGQMGLAIVAILFCLVSLGISVWMTYVLVVFTLLAQGTVVSGVLIGWVILLVATLLIFLIMFILLCVAAHQGSKVTCCASSSRVV